MPKYKLGNDTYTLPEHEVQGFLAEFPDAILIEEEEGKTNGVAETGATVTPTTGQAPETMESDSVDTSLVSQPNKINLDELKKTLPPLPEEGASRLQQEQFARDMQTASVKSQASKVEPIYNEIARNTPESEVTARLAINKFGEVQPRDASKKVYTPGMQMPEGMQVPMFNSDQEYDDYLKDLLQEDYEPYLDYLETGNIDIATPEERANARFEVVERKADLFTIANDIPEDVQKYISFSKNFGTGKNSQEEQEFALDQRKNNYEQMFADYNANILEWKNEAVPLSNSINEIQGQLKSFDYDKNNEPILTSTEEFNNYNSLIEQNNELITQWEKKGFGILNQTLISQQQALQIEEKNYNKMLDDFRKDLVDTAALKKSISKDYSVGARVGRAWDEMFVQDFVNLGNLLKQGMLEATKVEAGSRKYGLNWLTDEDYSASFDNLIDEVNKNNVNYNLEMFKKRENIPAAPTLDEIGEQGVDFWDWFSISFQDNSPVIATTFIPAAASLRGSQLVARATTKEARKQALKKQKQLLLAGKRTAQSIFFTAEAGGVFGDLQLENNDYSLFQKSLTAFLYGGAATYAETIGTLRVVTGGKNLAKNIGTKAARKEYYTRPDRFGLNIIGTTLLGLKSLPKGLAIEQIEETATQISHNFFDIVVLEKNKSLIEGLNKDFFANVATTSFGIMAPTTSSNIINAVKSEFRTRSEVLNNQKLTLELISLTQGPTTAETTNRKKEILQELALSDAVSLHKLRYMSADDITEVADLNRRMRVLNNRFRELAATGERSETAKSKKAKLQEEYNKLVEAQQGILNSKERNLKTREKKLNEALGKAARNNETAYWLGITDFYEDIALSQMGDGDYIDIQGDIVLDDFGQVQINYDNLDEKLSKYKGQKIIVKDKETKEDIVVDKFEYLKSSIQNGDFYGAKDGNDIIINRALINKAIALSPTSKEAQWAAVAPLEELFHLSVAGKKIDFENENAKAAIEEVVQVLDDKLDLNEISEEVYNDFMQRISLYRDENKIDVEEFIAQLNNMVALNDLNLSDFIEAPALIPLFNMSIRDVFGGMSWMLELNNSEDVFNLVKNFQQDVDKQVIQTAPEDEEIKESRTISPRGKEFIDLAKEDVFTNESLVETIKSPSSKAEDKFGAIEAIVENNFPVISKAIQFNPTGSIPMDAVKEAVTEQIQGIFPGRNTALFDTYDPETSKVTTFIDNTLRPRQAEILERAQAIGGTTQGVDITEARGVAVEETTPASTRGKALAKKPTETVVYSDEVLSNVGAANTEALENRITEEIQTAFKGKDISRFKELKDIPKNITQLYADMFGLSTVDGIVDFKRNFPKLDEGAVRNIRTFLNRNAEDDFRRLPKTKDDKNKATGIKQTKLGKVMYDANDNLVGTLKQYKDILQGKNITLPAYDGQMIEFNRMVDGKKLPIYRDSQHYKAALKFHIQNRIAEDVMPDKAQRLSAGLKFSKAAEQETDITTDIAKPIDQQNLQEVLSLDIKMSKATQQQKDEIVDKGPELLEAFQNETVKTTARFRPVLREMLSENFSDEDIQNVTPAIVRSFVKYEKYKDQLSNTSVGKISVEEIEQQELGTNLIKLLDLKEFINNFGQAFSDNYLIQKQRDLFAGFAAQKIKSPEDLITILKIYRGHQTSAGKIGGGRNQIFENNKDFIDELKKIDKVDIEYKPTKKGIQITSVSYDNKPIKDFKQKIKQVQQKSYKTVNGKRVVKSKEDFKKEFDLRQKEALQNWNELIDYLQYMRDNGTKLDFAMTMMSLKSNMSSMLKAAAPVSYYYVGPQFDVVTYEHLIPTEAIVLKLTDHFYGKKIDLESLRKRYNVAIIPEIMDSNINIQRQKSLPAYWNESMSETLRYYDDLTLGLKNMYAIESLEDGTIYGQEQADVARENEKLVVSKLKTSKVNNKKLPPNVRLEDPSTFDPFSMVNVVTMRMFPNKANSDAVKSGRLTAYEALDADEKFKVMAAVPGSPVENTLAVMEVSDQAIRFSRNANASDKGISVWDFDDTLATTKSNVLYTMPDGTTGTLNAEQFAKRGEDLLQEGAEFDFSEFEKVTKGAKGPMFEKAVARNKKFGNDNVFILTARTQAAAEPIHQFLKAIGLDIPLKNIVGLGNSTPEAKARWVVGKAAEGYNDFYFADDAYKNVKAVQDALSVLDVKSKVRQAYVKFSKASALDKGFNDILEQTTGIASEKEYKRVKAEVAGASRGKVFRGIPYSAQDFVGLLYETLSKGKLGDAQMAWYKQHLIRPFARAMNDIDNARLNMLQDYRALKKQLGVVPKDLRKKVPGEPYTREQAIRVYIWNKQGTEVPGISKQDLKDLTAYVAKDAELQVFADQIIAIQKGDQYASPQAGWPAGSITTDILRSINTGVRAKYLQQWQDNVDVIFSEKNMNKLEAAYGKPYRKAMENMLQRMRTGRNRTFSDDSLTGRFTDWLQGSIGTIMFFNTRSALLQTISAVNFINFTDNNPLAAAKAFANQKQYWSDFMTLINSDFLKARRSGLRFNVSEADIAEMAKQGGPRAVVNKLLQLGFAPTQIADSFAIASGGATFYRNRIKSLMKQGMSKAEAETQAFEDFRENAEESQQSSRPDRISMQQAGPLGRLILAFANTPAQYARLTDKAIRDLKNGRGDAKTNISKIIYYTTVQNLIFNAIQQAIFALAFDDEEPEDKEKKDKYISIANGMADSLLRGTGFGGAAISVGKNAIIRIINEMEKKQPKLEKVGYELTKISPPISAKLSRINQAARSYQWDKDEMINGGWGLDNPAYLAAGNVISALTNVPIDRGIKKANNIVKSTESDLELWERLALLGGWQDWEIGLGEETKQNKPQPRKTKKKSNTKTTRTKRM